MINGDCYFQIYRKVDGKLYDQILLNVDISYNNNNTMEFNETHQIHHQITNDLMELYDE